MQKLINVLALLSFCVSAGIVAGGTYVYLEKERLVESVKENIAEEIQGIVEDALVDGLNSDVLGGDSLPAPVPAEGGTPVPIEVIPF